MASGDVALSISNVKLKSYSSSLDSNTDVQKTTLADSSFSAGSALLLVDLVQRINQGGILVAPSLDPAKAYNITFTEV